MPPADVLNRWFTHFLYDVDNGVEETPRALVEREDGTLVSYGEWPVPGSEKVELRMAPLGDAAAGELTLEPQRRDEPRYETFTDIPTLTMAELVGSPDPEHGLVYATPALVQPVHLSGTPTATVRFKLGQPAANLTVGLVDIAPDGSVTRVITEGWRDPQNRRSFSDTQVVKPGTPYRLDVTMQAGDYVFAAGHRIGAVVMQSEEDFTILPPAGNLMAVDTTSSIFGLPVVGGQEALAAALGAP
jgi:X-Pro dipeptidyl-peptidase